MQVHVPRMKHLPPHSSRLGKRHTSSPCCNDRPLHARRKKGTAGWHRRLIGLARLVCRRTSRWCARQHKRWRRRILLSVCLSVCYSPACLAESATQHNIHGHQDADSTAWVRLEVRMYGRYSRRFSRHLHSEKDEDQQRLGPEDSLFGLFCICFWWDYAMLCDVGPLHLLLTTSPAPEPVHASSALASNQKRTLKHPPPSSNALAQTPSLK